MRRDPPRASLARKELRSRHIFGVRVLIERMDCRERWATSIPLTWTDARSEAERHIRAGRKATVVELDAEELEERSA